MPVKKSVSNGAWQSPVIRVILTLAVLEESFGKKVCADKREVIYL
jgi:hypothetical protein